MLQFKTKFNKNLQIQVIISIFVRLTDSQYNLGIEKHFIFSTASIVWKSTQYTWTRLNVKWSIHNFKYNETKVWRMNATKEKIQCYPAYLIFCFLRLRCEKVPVSQRSVAGFIVKMFGQYLFQIFKKVFSATCLKLSESIASLYFPYIVLFVAEEGIYIAFKSFWNWLTSQ